MRKLFKGIKQCLRWCQQEENSIATITNEGCPSVSKRKAPQTRTTPVHPTAFPRNGRKLLCCNQVHQEHVNMFAWLGKIAYYQIISYTE
jgi:hypothetical protein